MALSEQEQKKLNLILKKHGLKKGFFVSQAIREKIARDFKEEQ